jgi:hypothetical protein
MGFRGFSHNFSATTSVSWNAPAAPAALCAKKGLRQGWAEIGGKNAVQAGDINLICVFWALDGC